MRVLHIVTLISPEGSYGGPVRVAVNSCGELRRQGWNAELAAGWGSPASPPVMWESVPARLFPASRVAGRSGFRFLVSPALLRWLWRHVRDYDVLHVHAARELIPLLAMAVAVVRGVPFVTQTHGMIMPDARLAVRLLDRLATRPLLRRAQRHLALTDAERAGLSAVLSGAGGAATPASMPTVVLLGNGVQPQQHPTALPQSADIPALVVFCARLHPRKRVLAFADMAGMLLDRGYDADFIVAGPDEGELPELRRRLAARCDGRLRYVGALEHEQVLELLAGATVYVLPSVDEPYPMSLLEALSLGVPSVCTSSCGVAHLLARHGAGVVSDPKPANLADAVALLLDDDVRRSGLARAGRTLVEDVLSLTAVVGTLREIYATVIDPGLPVRV